MSQAWRPHPQFSHVALCDGPEGLAAIREPNFNAVIQMNAVPKPLLAEVAAASYAQLYSLPRAGRKPRWHRWFVSVMWQLGDDVARALDVGRDSINMDIRPQRPDGDEEPVDVQYFHRDGNDDGGGIRYRAIVHLCGPPTLWLPEAAPRKRIEFHYPAPLKTCIRFLAPVQWWQSMPEGSLALFTGQRVVGAVPALLHRAPRRWKGKRLTVALDIWV
jgi:hypothetical protein